MTFINKIHPNKVTLSHMRIIDDSGQWHVHEKGKSRELVRMTSDSSSQPRSLSRLDCWEVREAV